MSQQAKMGALMMRLSRQEALLTEVRAPLNELTIMQERGLMIKLDPKSPAEERRKLLLKVINEGARVTGAAHDDGQLTARYKVKPLEDRIPKEWEGYVLQFFSMELAELEMEVVATRAKLESIKRNVGIHTIEELDERQFPSKHKTHIGTVNSWDEAVTKVKLLHRAGCIQYFTAVTEDEFGSGKYKTQSIDHKLFQILDETAPDLRFRPEIIELKISEVGRPNGKIVKQIICVLKKPTKMSPSMPTVH